MLPVSHLLVREDPPPHVDVSDGPVTCLHQQDIALVPAPAVCGSSLYCTILYCTVLYCTVPPALLGKSRFVVSVSPRHCLSIDEDLHGGVHFGKASKQKVWKCDIF